MADQLTPQEQVQELVQSVIDIRKNTENYRVMELYFNNEKKYNKDNELIETKYPDYYSTYCMAVELAEANRYHCEKGVFPYKLFSAKSPYQTDAELTYIRDNYKQVTLPIAVDYINTISRAFIDGNYSIKYAGDTDKYLNDKTTLQEYLEKGIDNYGSLENFIKSVLPTIKTIDANGVIAIKPFFITEKNEADEDIISSTELNEPQPIYFDCSRVVAFKEEHYCLIDTTNYSQYTKEKPKVWTYELYDRNAIWNITYDNVDKKFEIEIYYQHDLGILPCMRLKGIPRLIDGDILWQSPFSFATDILDIIAINHSTLDIATKKCAFPIRVYEGRPCTFQYTDREKNVSQCTGGQVYDSSLGKSIDCPSCHGVGLIDRFSPIYDFITNPGDQFNQASPNKTPFQYVAPDSAILKFLQDSNYQNEVRARAILHLQTSNSNVTGTPELLATGMALDNKAMYAFVKPISDQMFEIWEFIIDMIGMFRYGSEYKRPTFGRPFTFDFNTEYDYMIEISTAVNAGLPPVVIHSIIERFLRSHFFSDTKTSNAFKLIMAADRLLGLSNIDIQNEAARGVISKWEQILHDSAITLIDNLVIENDKFFEQDIESQTQQLINSAKEIEKANKPPVEVNGVPTIIETILSRGKNNREPLPPVIVE